MCHTITSKVIMMKILYIFCHLSNIETNCSDKLLYQACETRFGISKPTPCQVTTVQSRCTLYSDNYTSDNDLTLLQLKQRIFVEGCAKVDDKRTMLGSVIRISVAFLVNYITY